ncbi:MAG: transposase [Marinirhabdus sp.]|nr:transposase [Marinirhabdus sp.]
MKTAEDILNRMTGIGKSQKKFMIILFKTVLALSGRVNFSNLSRYSDLNEKTYSRNFRRHFDFTHFNSLGIEQVYNPSHEYILAGDASYIPKSGKGTYGLGKFWNGVQSRSMNGLEISNFAIVDVKDKTAYTLKVNQVPPSNDEENAIDFFLSQLRSLKEADLTIPLPKNLTVDGLYAKQRFVDGATGPGFTVISKLRKDANLKYLYEQTQDSGNPAFHKKRSPGRPRKFAGKINLKSPDFSKLPLAAKINEHLCLYSAVVYSVALKRNIKLVYLQHTAKNGKTSYVVIFSTDLTMSAETIYRYYTSRFQIEFIFRDAKQFTGLTHCQARGQESLDFHFNMSLALLNLARIDHRLQNKQSDDGFSMASYKRRYANEMMLNLIFSKLELDPNLHKIQKVYHELQNYGVIAA